MGLLGFIGGQGGYSFGEGGGPFWEVGAGIPGGSITGFHAWKWSWKGIKKFFGWNDE